MKTFFFYVKPECLAWSECTMDIKGKNFDKVSVMI